MWPTRQRWPAERTEPETARTETGTISCGPDLVRRVWLEFSSNAVGLPWSVEGIWSYLVKDDGQYVIESHVRQIRITGYLVERSPLLVGTIL
mmetsp:Transcript_4216/g.15141  ORF Transcript_4216/g.15141 Transcript_4216/m.15141 type:complete len:92 (-) Transcript_4216:108-383(-)